MLAISIGWGQQISIEFRSERPQSYQYRLIAGIAADATVCLDTALGEVEIPLLPPEGLYPVFLLPCVDSITGVSVMSPVDLRPYPSAGDSVEYQIYIQRDGYPLHVRWQLPLAGIDSAYLFDPFAVYRFALHRDTVGYIDNTAIRELVLQVWYTAGYSTVDQPYRPLLVVQRFGEQQILVPLKKVVTKGGDPPLVKIWNLQGQLVATVRISSRGAVQIPTLPVGVYFVEVVQSLLPLVVY